MSQPTHTTLVVSYLPRQEGSNTKRLLDHFLKEYHQNTAQSSAHVLQHLELTETPPPLLLTPQIKAYDKRAFLGQELTVEEQTALAPADVLAQQFKKADTIVLAYPIHNYSFPAVMKAYLDAVLQKEVAFTYTSEGRKSLINARRGIFISSSGGDYKAEYGNADWEVFSPLAKKIQEHLDITDGIVMNLPGTLMYGDKLPGMIAAKQAEITELVKRWYQV